MSVPPDVLAQMKQGLGGGAAGAPPGAPDNNAMAPGGAPMVAPQEKDGTKEAARVSIHIAMNMLEQALPAFGSETKEGKAILSHLSGLARTFGERDSSDLVPAEVMQMVKGLPQVGGGTDVQKMLMQMMSQPGGGGQPQPPGGPKPPGMPPIPPGA